MEEKQYAVWSNILECSSISSKRVQWLSSSSADGKGDAIAQAVRYSGTNTLDAANKFIFEEVDLSLLEGKITVWVTSARAWKNYMTMTEEGHNIAEPMHDTFTLEPSRLKQEYDGFTRTIEKGEK
jgi:hypothetical protein